MVGLASFYVKDIDTSQASIREARYSPRSAKYTGSRPGRAVEQIVLFIKHNSYGNVYHCY